MKIIFVSFLNEDIRPGYEQKIHGQYKAFNLLGHETYLYIVKKYGMALYKYDGEEKTIEKFYTNYKRKNEERNIHDEFKLIQLWIKNLKEIIEKESPQAIYIRRIVPLNPFLIHFLKWVRHKRIKIIYEYPTFPWKEEQKNSNKLFYYLDSLYFKTLVSIVDVITYIGKYQGNNPKFCKVNNSIDIDKLLLHKKRDGKSIALIGVAHIAYYHGFDRIILGLKQYYASSRQWDVFFHIVGDGDILDLKLLVKKFNLENRVFFDGVQTGEELDKVFNKCDIGVDALGGFRREKGLFSDSLKSKEYIARGIPYIVAGTSSFETKNLDFVFEFNETEEPIDIEKIINLYNQMKSTPEQIREFAVDNFQWKNEMIKPLEYLEKQNLMK